MLSWETLDGNTKEYAMPWGASQQVTNNGMPK